MAQLLQRSQVARIAADFDLALLFLAGAIEVVRPFSSVALVIGIALVLITPLLAIYVHRAPGRRRLPTAGPMPPGVFARQSVRRTGYLVLALAFVFGCAGASGYWIRSGPLAGPVGLASFLVILAVPLAAAYLHDCSVRGSELPR